MKSFSGVSAALCNILMPQKMHRSLCKAWECPGLGGNWDNAKPSILKEASAYLFLLLVSSESASQELPPTGEAPIKESGE
ncbi:hypothetical protein EYF80_040057 [Liparis tanakae]|uniref:Uncharacterized protein n=1 Tax=Liparis tanakae TaxID=230148 RepID=A0A4Z2G9M9_9TELE|nr:hypothetical protein EYF80_040057 [Liparis tanakae]